MGSLEYKNEDPVPKPKVVSGVPNEALNGMANPVTTLKGVDPNVYAPGAQADNTWAMDQYKSLYGAAGAPTVGGGGGKDTVGSLSLADRSGAFNNLQDQTTKYASNLMTGASDTANGMFGQGTYNQMTGDNDQVVQADVAALQEQFGGNVNHPAFIKAKNEMLQTAKMFNARAYTDLKQKAGQYGLQVGELVNNYVDAYATREDNQRKLKLATDQYNIELKMKKQQMGQSAANSAANRAFSQKMACLAAIAANSNAGLDRGLQASNIELEARVADKVTELNIQLENRKLDVAQATAKKQQKTSIFSSILKAAVGFIPIVGDVLKNANVGF
jgi:hypothetical protein